MMFGFTIAMMIIHLSFYVFIFSFLARHKSKTDRTTTGKLSILVCAKNEEKSLPQLVSALKSQSVDQTIIVDDRSTDQTAHIIQQHDWISYVKTGKETAGKKNAQRIGIRASENDRILCTDADCTPASSEWASAMNNHPTPFVLGYGPSKKGKGLVALFAKYETYITGIQYLSYALAGMPYMGVGRNMLITRSAIDREKIKGKQLASGDDDLTINALANAENTSVCIDPKAFVYSPSKSNLRAFFKQKKRHVSTSVHYKMIHQVLLGLWSTSQILFFILLLAGIFWGSITIPMAFILLCCKWFVQGVFHHFLMKKLKETELLLMSPILDMLLFLYYLIMPFIVVSMKKERKWS